MSKYTSKHKKAYRKWYYSHRDTAILRVKYYKKKALLNKIKQYFGGKQCKRCGTTDFRVLVLHRKNYFSRGRTCKVPLESLLSNPTNIEVYCANCHLLVHYKQLEHIMMYKETFGFKLNKKLINEYYSRENRLTG